ncbi:beta-N-acetylhexosaminidase [Fluviicoccus keumensis]|uniref:Beta-hexosaminidase n=1 Tax=Fluviicoccus keumensis TaxID=1435465 RepID=A0A4Q7Z404_9GAMM|nr:beta-N-acetylhexosaminidase [Fluviicoccus keumensis]RZU45040.1 beta-N-acetylhexosaminidase [Fluviicoccus keumensis]
MIGSVMLDLKGTEMTPEEREVLQHPQTGGVIFFARNYEGPEQIQALTASIRRVRPELILAVDQEGGRVQRFRDGFVRIPPMKALGERFSASPEQARQLAYQWGWLMATEVLAVGVDISFAPILDLDNGLSRVIGDRAFHAEPEVAIALLGPFIKGMHDAGMAATGKHFPGHGSVEADSHVAIPVDTRSFADIEKHDLKPFVALASALQGIMPAHVIFPEIDNRPAGFSPIWLQDVLRQRIGFRGVIFSDDLSMEGAGVAGSYADRAEAALSAGCDMVLVCNKPEAAIQVLESREGRPLPDQARFAALKGRSRVAWNELPRHPQWIAAEESIRNLISA